jgi:hypothetical protein
VNINTSTGVYFGVSLAVFSLTFFVARHFGTNAGIATFVVCAAGAHLLQSNAARGQE